MIRAAAVVIKHGINNFITYLEPQLLLFIGIICGSVILNKAQYLRITGRAM